MGVFECVGVCVSVCVCVCVCVSVWVYVNVCECLCVCVFVFFTLREECRLRVFDYSVLRRKLARNRDEVTRQ